jgi:OOP family OmpA-OmpF porin
LGNGDAKIMIYKLDLLYHLTGLLPGDMIVPYLAAGPGMITWDSDRKDVDTNNDFLLNYGGGLKIFLTKDLALRGDMRNVINFHASDDRGSSFLYTAGLTYEIGGKVKEEVMEEPPAPEPVPAPAPVVTPPPPPPAPAPKVMGSIIFRNILFDFDKSNIKPESYPILDEVTEYLKSYPDLKMEVQGHTDSKGTAEYNLKLSDRRAASVKKYLVDKGVEADRLETKGYGLTKPIAPNDTEENRARNRRVEFKPIQ